MKTLLLLLLASGSALADDASVLQCRTMADAGKRLACYDAMVVGAKPAPSAAPVAAAVPTAAAVPAATAVPAPAWKGTEQSFGLEQKAALSSLESTIPGKFTGWRPKQQITLANGQVWRISDESTADVDGTDLKVRLEKGIFGATYMRIQGVNQAPTVRRVK